VFKLFTLGTLEKKTGTVKNKRDMDDFYMGNIRQLIYSKYARGQIHAVK
jgi:hypothetical protein